MTLDRYWCNQKNTIEFLDSFVVTRVAHFASRCFTKLLAVNLWIPPVLRLVLSVAFAILEQCKVFGASGVLMKLLFRQVEFCVQLLSVALQ